MSEVVLELGFLTLGCVYDTWWEDGAYLPWQVEWTAVDCERTWVIGVTLVLALVPCGAPVQASRAGCQAGRSLCGRASAAKQGGLMTVRESG